MKLFAAVLIALVLNKSSVPADSRRATEALKQARMRALTAQVLAEVSQIRQLSIRRAVPSEMQPKGALEKQMAGHVEDDKEARQMESSELGLKKLGMVPRDFHIKTFMVRLLSEQVAGYYDSEKKKFFVMDQTPGELLKTIMAHELTHALQDQHFDLQKLMQLPPGNSDRTLALQSMVEGEAQFVTTLYTRRHPPNLVAMLKSALTAGQSSKEFNQAPPALSATLIFPYLQGEAWISFLYSHGGWNAVSKAYTRQPSSSQQIMHPEKYLAGKNPVPVRMRDASALLGKGWKRLDHDVDGEWGTYWLLKQFLPDDESGSVAAGWAGDIGDIYKGPARGDVVVSQSTLWDSDWAAQQFFAAYAKRTALRYKDEHVAEVSVDEKAIRRWTTSEGDVMMEIRGHRVMIVEGAAAEPGSRLLAAMWAH